MTQTTLPKPIEVLAVGTRPDRYGREYSFTEADLQKMVVANAKREKPLVVGHPGSDSPFYGKGTALEARDGKLLLTAAQDIDPTFSAIVNTGELSGVSLKLLAPGHPENDTDTYLIRHIGFLGKSPPAWENLSPAEFSNADATELEFAIFEDTPVTQQKTQSPPAEKSQHEAEFAQRQADLEKREAEFAQRQATFNRAEAIRPFLRQLEGDGKLLPTEVPGFEALFSQFDDKQEIEFSKGDETEKVAGLTFLKTFLKGLPKRVELDEQTASGEAEFSRGQVDPVALAGRIADYRAKHPQASYAEALSAVQSGKAA
ncbi:hypothetical protein [Vacuolonema iberomarrocanum]|uniref:hypothetical protein n=1 Tax=Vacuolonema iberomarrocanum TaxID=3454632 RepID=UPI0019F32381|nr:hypothetical protein [filamentous cyanobacterium LEGE 07170]